MSRIESRSTYFLLVPITCASIVLAYILFFAGRHELLFDASGYYQLGEQIAKDGLFSFRDVTRTYGFPLFVAIFWLVSDHLPSTVQFLIFNAQWLILLGACFYAHFVFQHLFQSTRMGICLFALLLLNPIVLVFTGEAIADLLSGVLIFAALLLAIQNPLPETLRLTGNRRFQRNRKVELLSFTSLFVAGCAAIVRPANLPIALAVVFVWAGRYRLFGEGSVRSFLSMLIGFVIPFIPQMIINYLNFAQFQPLIVRSLYSEQLDWGIRYLKFMGVVSPGYKGGLALLNPLLPSGVSNFSAFFSSHPFEFFQTQGIHLYALFDYDLVFPYAADPAPWYRLPLWSANNIYLFGAFLGIALWLMSLLRGSSFRRLDLALSGILGGILVYLPAYVFTAVETRFSLPIYLLLGPFFVLALEQIAIEVMGKRWSMILAKSFTLLVFLIASFSLYSWLRSQVQFWDYLGGGPYAFDQSAMKEINVRFGDQVRLVEYMLNPAGQTQGGNSQSIAVKFSWQQESTTPLDAQIALVDSQGHIWSQMIPRIEGRSFSIPSLLSTQSATELVALPIPVTIPSSEYSIIVSLHDRVTGQLLSAFQPTGESLGESVQLATLAVVKNKSSFTASQLHIENPFFVDMQEMRLLGHAPLSDRASPNTNLDLGLYWRARDKPRGDYAVVIQLQDASGNVVFEQSSRPAEGSYPTTQWNAGEVLLDWHRLTIPSDIPQAEYNLIVKLRNVEQGQILGEANIAKIEITP